MAPKSMTVQEITEIARELKTWVGSQFQDVVIDGIKGEDPRSIRLGFFWTGGVRWIVLDYRVQAPLLMLFDGHDGVPMTPPKTAGKIRRPIELFLRSKHVGRRLRDVRVRIEDGRALALVFDSNTDGSEVSIELSIYPHGRNARAISGEQSVQEFKSLGEAKTVQGTRAKSFAELERPLRSNFELVEEWLAFVKPSYGSKAQPADRENRPTIAKSPHDLKLEKSKKALAKVREEIQLKENSPARSIGEWLKENQTTLVPLEWPEAWRSSIDPEKSLAFNIEKQFALAKSQARKLDGTRARALEIEKEIAVLTRKLARGEMRDESGDARGGRGDESLRGGGTKDLFQAAQARGRKYQVSDDLIVYLGKNAAENLAILRKAQPFDYWLHLRDRPGAHAILRRTRGRNVTDSEFMKAAVYVAEQTMKRRAIEMKGESFDLLIVECRYVRPIKGDKLGRVNYTHDRVLRVSL